MLMHATVQGFTRVRENLKILANVSASGRVASFSTYICAPSMRFRK
jgi:hypothetical protein